MSAEGRVPQDDAAILIRRLISTTAVAHERQAQLQQALDSRVVLEQAKGMLAERLGVTVDEAFALLRAAARSRRMRLHDAARAVVAHDSDFDLFVREQRA
jgi:AmiR/NasT family two-component response regulator